MVIYSLLFVEYLFSQSAPISKRRRDGEAVMVNFVIPFLLWVDLDIRNERIRGGEEAWKMENVSETQSAFPLLNVDLFQA